MPAPLLFATNSNPDLTLTLSQKTGLPLGKYQLGRFADGEVNLTLEEDVTGRPAVVLGSSFPPAENLLELATLINTTKINGAAKITTVIPYFGYAKSDRTDRPGRPVNARLLAKFLEQAGSDQVIAVNLHSRAVEKFFSVPLIHLSAMPLLADYFTRLKLINFAVASPDRGGTERAKEFAHVLGLKSIITVEKTRPTESTAQVVALRGRIKSKNIILADDLVQTGNTLLQAAKALKAQGAADLYVAVTHFVYTAAAAKTLDHSPLFKKIVITDTIPRPGSLGLSDKFVTLSVTDLLASALTGELPPHPEVAEKPRSTPPPLRRSLWQSLKRLVLPPQS